MLQEELKNRNLPDVMTFKNGEKVKTVDEWRARREEILEILREEIYGFAPPPPKEIRYEIKKCDDLALAGKAIHSKIDIKFDAPKGEFSFPINLFVPRKGSPAPLFLHIEFRPEIPDKYYPVEEIIDNGFATASFCHKDVDEDKSGFESGLISMFSEGERKSNDWGKISAWAYAASRVMDYLQTLDTIDTGKIIVAGHSRLGKTSLWCSAQDERFFGCASNDAGCSGDALSRGKSGEHIEDIIRRFDYWFCDNYKKYVRKENELPFDQHFLLSLLAPRNLCIGSAEWDLWSDPQSQFLGCLAASPVYELHGKKGLVTEDRYPQTGDALHGGSIGFHLREGTHYFSRDDWHGYMEYFKNACKIK